MSRNRHVPSGADASTQQRDSTGPAQLRTTALIWTYNRRAVAVGAIEAVRAQTVAVDELVVVDSASPDGTAAALRSSYPDATVIELDENLGMGAAIAAGLAEVTTELVWFIEDDSRPARDGLALALDVMDSEPAVGIVGPAAGCMRRVGLWKRLSPLAHGRSRRADFVYLDGALSRMSVLEAHDGPRADFFIMFVDLELPLRLHRAGIEARQVGSELDALRLGAAAASPWRAYYQTRNHLRMAIDLRSPRLLFGFVLRLGRQLILLPPTDVVRYRCRGIADAFGGRMGRTVEPH